MVRSVGRALIANWWLRIASCIAASVLAISLIALGITIIAVEASGPCQSSPGPSSVNGIPSTLLPIYEQAAGKYTLGPDGWAYLAAINYHESSFGTDLSTSSAGAVGWMQFEPSTWAQYGVTPDGTKAPNGPAGWNDPQDAIFSAANYLRASGAPANWPSAVYAYNHASWYVAMVTATAQQYLAAGAGAQTQPVSELSVSPGCTSGVSLVAGQTARILPNGIAEAPAEAPAQVQSMIAAGNRLIHFGYSYGGGHCTAAMNQQNPDPAATCPGQEENGYPGYDCSSTVSYVLWGGGLATMIGGAPEDSTALMSMGAAGGGQWVTWFSNPGHVYMQVAGIYMNTENGEWLHSPPQPPDTGPRWSTPNSIDSPDRPGFVPRHPPGL